MATDSNRVRSGPRLVTSVNRNQIDTGAQFSVILGTGANLHNYILIEILLKKVRHRKCEPLGPVDSPNLHNYVLIEILLQKVRHKKCDPFVCGIQVWSTGQTKPPQLDINRNYAQKSAT